MKNKKLLVMTDIAILIALSEILSFFSIRLWPNGGSISLEMLPIFLITLKYDVKEGIFAGLLFGLIHSIGGYIFSPLQALLDYPLAFSMIGLAGIFNHLLWQTRKNRWIWLACFLGGILRTIVHVISALLFFSNGNYTAPVITSIVIYNVSYVFPSVVICAWILTIIKKHYLFFEQVTCKK